MRDSLIGQEYVNVMIERVLRCAMAQRCRLPRFWHRESAEGIVKITTVTLIRLHGLLSTKFGTVFVEKVEDPDIPHNKTTRCSGIPSASV